MGASRHRMEIRGWQGRHGYISFKSGFTALILIEWLLSVLCSLCSLFTLSFKNSTWFVFILLPVVCSVS